VTLIERAQADLRLIAEYWPGLAELRDPSVHAPRPPMLLTSEQRAELDYQARFERLERDGVAPGEHQDAARAEILDLMASLTFDAAALVETISARIPSPWARPDLPSTAFADPAPLLSFVIEHLAAADAQDARVARWTANEARRMVVDVNRALCHAHDGHVLTTICPWCRGGLTGGRTLRVRILPGDEVAIVCESDIPCEPPRRKVTTWWQSRPCWPFRDWRWLAKQLHAVDERERTSA
jgi:hypothetical protein